MANLLRTLLSGSKFKIFLFWYLRRIASRLEAQFEGDCLAAKLRPGNGHSAEDWEELLLPEIERQQKFGADAAFAKPEIYQASEDGWDKTDTGKIISRRSIKAKNDAAGLELWELPRVIDSEYPRAALIEGKDAHRSRADLNPLEKVERDACVVGNDGFNDVAVADNYDGLFRVLLAQPG
jgi:hypothetical protein